MLHPITHLTFDGQCFIIRLEAIKRYLRCLVIAQRKQINLFLRVTKQTQAIPYLR